MPVYELREEKSKIRQKYKQIRSSVSEEEKKMLDSKICEKFLSCVSYRYCDTILMYSPVRDEINVNAIALKALEDGKRVAYPRCIPGTNKMNFHFVSSLDELEKGTFGISEPPETNERFSKKSNGCVVCLVPALAYDKYGYRIGYGKGFYDRYLSYFTGSVIGIVYKSLISDTPLPRGKFDVCANALVTEEGVYSIARI